ncbi:MAG: hypothetical protein PVF05_11240 [Gemmatimonadales bacterium]
MHRPASGFAALLALALTVPGTARAQDPNLVDQGRFDIRVGDRTTGTETFAIRRQGEGYMAVGRLQLEGTGAWLRSAEVMLRTDGSYAPVRYRYESRVEGERRMVDLTRAGTRLRVSTTSAEGERMTELLANPRQVLLGPGIAEHYYFLVRRLSAGGRSLTALLPQEGREAPIRLVGSRDTTVDVGSQAVPARRWEVEIDGSTHLVWSDLADGRVLRVEIPDRQWRSVRRAEE